MKNAINYYYNLYPKNIYHRKKEYYFYIDKIKYSFIQIEEDLKINEIYKIHLEMLRKNIYVHTIVVNIELSPITIINKKKYLLLQIINEKKDIALQDIFSFMSVSVSTNEINWGKLWENKNDYLEFQISKLGTNYKKIRDSFSYFIGLGETAIAIYNSIPNEPVNTVYSHKRIDDLYNPLNIIIDSKVRDAAEYFKKNHFNGKEIEKELYYYISIAKLNYHEYILFFARLIYPTPYYDLFEEIITGREDEKKIEKIINRQEEYELIIKKLYHQYKSFINITPIEWLE